MATYDDTPKVAPTLSAETGKPGVPPVTPQGAGDDQPDVDKAYWERCLTDAERAEHDFRARGREIIKIYRNDGTSVPLTGKKRNNSDIVFNILFSNTEVMLPNIYAIPPTPVVRSRFAKKSSPPVPMPPTVPPPMAPPGMAPPPAGPPQPGGAGPLPPPVGGLPPEGAPPMMAEPGGGIPSGPPPMVPPPGAAVPPESNTIDIGLNVTGLPQPLPEPPPPPPPPGPPQMMPGGPAPLPPGLPAQEDIETAAAVMQKALEIVLDDDVSHEAVKAAVKDLLLPGRGTCRVRWYPQLKSQPVTDPVMGGGLSLPGEPPPLPGAEPFSEQVKIWETVADEYVYWEDILYDPVRQFSDGMWIGFRHLFDKKSLMAEFEDSPELQQLEQSGKLGDVLKWTEESAAKNVVGGGGAMKTAEKLGDVIKKAMVWEIWDKLERRVIWFVREVEGIVLRVDEDSLGLSNFFPVPKPLLAVTTTDSMLPRPYYDLYRHLAQDLDETSRRISQLIEKIKIRGGYNASNRDIAAILTADDGKMLPIAGIDLINGGLQNHIWIVPILEWVNALKELYLAREQTKQAIYEVMGISDIMRGNSNPYETATAQRIKGTMGTNRLEEHKNVCANFARELLRMKAEIISKNFDADTLTRMTGEEVTPAVEAILRDDFQRTCTIDIETDSTVSIDEAMEQESNAKIMMAMQGIMTGAAGLLKIGVLPPPMIIQFTLEMIKMMIHPIRNSRAVTEMIADFQEQIQAQMMAPPPMMPPPGLGMGAGQTPSAPMPPPNGALPPGPPIGPMQ
jgi:hypothetical protein